MARSACSPSVAQIPTASARAEIAPHALRPRDPAPRFAHWQRRATCRSSTVAARRRGDSPHVVRGVLHGAGVEGGDAHGVTGEEGVELLARGASSAPRRAARGSSAGSAARSVTTAAACEGQRSSRGEDAAPRARRARASSGGRGAVRARSSSTCSLLGSSGSVNFVFFWLFFLFFSDPWQAKERKRGMQRAWRWLFVPRRCSSARACPRRAPVRCPCASSLCAAAAGPQLFAQSRR